MKKKLVVLINDLASNEAYLDFLRLKFEVETVKFSVLRKMSEFPNNIDLILFSGGEDVDPQYYGERPGKFTSYNTERDNIESKMFRFLNTNIPKLGICRGAQFLTVMSGGKLIQHVENHAIGGTHLITFDYLINKNVKMTSTHHQMMNPYSMEKDEYQICAYSTKHLSPIYFDGSDSNIELSENFLEPEVVFYPKRKALAIQGHPESGVMTIEDKMFMLNYICNILSL